MPVKQPLNLIASCILSLKSGVALRIHAWFNHICTVPAISTLFSSSSHNTMDTLSRQRGPEVQDLTESLISRCLIAHPGWLLLGDSVLRCRSVGLRCCASLWTRQTHVLGRRVLMRMILTCSGQLRIPYGDRCGWWWFLFFFFFFLGDGPSARVCHLRFSQSPRQRSGERSQAIKSLSSWGSSTGEKPARLNYNYRSSSLDGRDNLVVSAFSDCLGGINKLLRIKGKYLKIKALESWRERCVDKTGESVKPCPRAAVTNHVTSVLMRLKEDRKRSSPLL